MRARYVLGAMVLILGVGLLRPHPAQAGTVLYDSANFVVGQQSFVQAFTLTTAATVTVTLSSIPWLDTIMGLNCFLTSASGVVSSWTGEGSESVHLGAGTYYSHWYGEAGGQYKIGVDKLRIEADYDHSTTVPLPASLVLLLSGLGVLFGWQRREGTGTGAAA